MTGEDGTHGASGAVDFHSLPLAALRIAGGRVVAANRAYEELTGVRAQDVVGREVAALIASFVVEDDAPMVRGVSDSAAARRAAPGDLWCRVTDGEGITHAVRVLWRPAPERTREDDRFVFLIPADVDAHERAFAERLALAAAELLRCPDERAVLERAADALAAGGYTVTFLLLREGEPRLAYGPTRSPRGVSNAALYESVPPPRETLTRINPHFYERRAAFYQHPDGVLHAAFPGDVADALEPKLPGRRMVQAPVFVADAPYAAMVVTDDRLTHVSVGTLEMYAQLVGAAVENVRLHQRATARLEQLERLQGDLLRTERLAALGEAAAVMAHEVRNPIAAILNAAVLLQRAETSRDAEAELRKVIAEEAARLERLVSDLLALGRPLVPRVREANLAEIAEEAVSVLRARRELRDCVVAPVESDGTPAAVDPELVELAVLNVVRNAVEASPPGGRVRLGVRADGEDGVALDVEDEGPGLSEDVARRMLEPFFTTRATGTGIGLAVVRRVLDANRGTFAAGRGASGGARITLRFPAWRG